MWLSKSNVRYFYGEGNVLLLDCIDVSVPAVMSALVLQDGPLEKGGSSITGSLHIIPEECK